MTNERLAKAKRLLVHYFRLADAVSDQDDAYEIEEIIECIEDYIDARIRAALEQRTG